MHQMQAKMTIASGYSNIEEYLNSVVPVKNVKPVVKGF